MIDSLTNEPIRIAFMESGPYVFVQLDQLEQVKKILDEGGFRYWVDEDAISLNGQPYTSVVNLGREADVAAIQDLLDKHTGHEGTGRRRGGHR
jgi:hypothetical protein